MVLFQFFIGYMLAWTYIAGPLLTFVESQNGKGNFNLGDGFSAENLFWDPSAFWPNFFRLLTVVFFGGGFGLTYGYISKATSRYETIVISFFASLTIVLRGLFLIYIGSVFHKNSAETSQDLAIALNIIFASFYRTTFIILQLLSVFSVCFYCISWGNKLRNDPNNKMDKENNRTMLNVKWYHYFWLWLPVAIYSELLYRKIIATAFSILFYFKQIRWFEFLGISVYDKNGTNTDIGNTNLEKIGYQFLGAFLTTTVVFLS